MNMDKLFDLVCHMNANSDVEYELVKGHKLSRKQQAVLLHKSVQAFIHATGGSVSNTEGTRRLIQAFSGSGDLPILTKDVFNVTNAVPNFDTFWQLAFQGIQLRQGELAWEIANVSSGINFELVPEGGKAKFYGFTGSKQIVSIEKYGAGIGVTWEMIHARKLYLFVQQMQMVRSELFVLWANIHYGLLAAAALLALVPWQGIVTDPVIDRDIATINKAYTTIGNAVKDKGYGDTANAVMYLYVSPLLKARVGQALRAVQSDIVSGRIAGGVGSRASQVVEFNVIPQYTYNGNIPANKGVMVLPGHKIQNSVYIQELGLGEMDIVTLSKLETYWTMFGAVVADTDQTAELSFT